MKRKLSFVEISYRRFALSERVSVFIVLGWPAALHDREGSRDPGHLW